MTYRVEKSKNDFGYWILDESGKVYSRVYAIQNGKKWNLHQFTPTPSSEEAWKICFEKNITTDLGFEDDEIEADKSMRILVEGLVGQAKDAA